MNVQRSSAPSAPGALVAGAAPDAFDTAALGLVPGTPLVRVRTLHVPAGADLALAHAQHAMVMLIGPAPTRGALRGLGPILRRAFGPGDLILVPPDAPAILTSETETEGLALLCEVERLPEFARDEIGVALTGARFEDRRVVHDRALWQAARAFRGGLAEDGPGRALLFDSLARVFLATLVRRWGVIAPSGPLGPERMAALRAWLDEAMTGSPGVGGMARAAGLPARRFARDLRAETGLAPLAFLRAARVARARDLIAAGVPLGSVALRCGFADQAHLTRSFKAVTGHTPTAWRRARGGP